METAQTREWRAGAGGAAIEAVPLGGGALRVRARSDAAPGSEAAVLLTAAETERRLRELAAAGRPVRRALAAIAARLVTTRAYEPLCYARLGDYARERAGLSARQLRDLAHVHAALVALPRLDRALVAGELPWSKVRLVVRVASEADVEAWIARARALPIRLLEQEVRLHADRVRAASDANGARGANDTAAANDTGAANDAGSARDAGSANDATSAGGERCASDARCAASAAGASSVGAGAGAFDPGEDVPCTRVALACTPAVREKWSLARELAERVAGQRLRAEDALEWVTAEACSAAAIGPWLTAGPCSPPARARGEHEGDLADTAAVAREACARALPSAPCPLAGALTDGLEHADAFEIDRRLREAIHIEQRLDAAIAPLLRIVTSPEHEWTGLYHSLAAFAAEQLGMSPARARALLRIERAGDVCPALREAFRNGSLSWAKALCLVPLLLLDLPGEWRPRWVAWAGRVTVRRLGADVERALALRGVSAEGWQRCTLDPELAQQPLSEAERQKCAADRDADATERLAWRVPVDVAGLFFAARTRLRERLRTAGRPFASEGEVFEALLDHAIATWTLRDPSARPPDPVIERDRYLCAVPGCSSRCSLQDHHIVFRSAQGSGAPENRITLCAFHHQRCLHLRRLRITGEAPVRLVFELGVRTGAPPLARYRSGDVAL